MAKNRPRQNQNNSILFKSCSISKNLLSEKNLVLAKSGNKTLGFVRKTVLNDNHDYPEYRISV
jgi:hypothetical protein